MIPHLNNLIQVPSSAEFFKYGIFPLYSTSSESPHSLTSEGDTEKPATWKIYKRFSKIKRFRWLWKSQSFSETYLRKVSNLWMFSERYQSMDLSFSNHLANPQPIAFSVWGLATLTPTFQTWVILSELGKLMETWLNDSAHCSKTSWSWIYNFHLC